MHLWKSVQRRYFWFYFLQKRNTKDSKFSIHVLLSVLSIVFFHSQTDSAGWRDHHQQDRSRPCTRAGATPVHHQVEYSHSVHVYQLYCSFLYRPFEEKAIQRDRIVCPSIGLSRKLNIGYNFDIY